MSADYFDEFDPNGPAPSLGVVVPETDEPRVLVTKGPPGTGKTTLLTDTFRFEAQQRGVGPERVAFLAFTNGAANTAKKVLGNEHRETKELGFTPSELRNVRTLHSLACGLLKVDHTKLMTDDQKAKFREEKFPALAPAEAKRYESIVDRARAKGLSKAQLHTCVTVVEARKVDAQRLGRYFDAFADYILVNRILTFEDVLVKILASKGTAHELVPDIDVLIVDEAQDLNPTAADVIDWWGTKCLRLHVVGDDDQTIYTFAGADPAWFQGLFLTHQGKTLVQSKRVPRLPYELAVKVIGQVKNRISAPYLPKAADGEVIRGATAAQLPKLLNGKENLVLARDSWALKHVKEALDAAGMPYTESSNLGGGDAQLVMLTKAGMNLASGGAMFARELLKLVQRRNRVEDGPLKAHLQGMAGAAVTEQELVQRLGRLALLDEFLLRQPEALGPLNKRQRQTVVNVMAGLPPSRITLSTIHAAKGAEADVVAIVPDRSAASFDAAQLSPQGADDEARLLYVALTRTMHRLILMAPSEPKNAFRAFKFPANGPSSP